MSRRRSSRRTEPGSAGANGRAGGSRPSRGRASPQRRLARTVVLGSLAVAAAIAWLATEFGMDTGELLDYAATSAVVVGVLVLLGLVGAALLRGLKHLLGRRR